MVTRNDSFSVSSMSSISSSSVSIALATCVKRVVCPALNPPSCVDSFARIRSTSCRMLTIFSSLRAMLARCFSCFSLSLPSYVRQCNSSTARCRSVIASSTSPMPHDDSLAAAAAAAAARSALSAASSRSTSISAAFSSAASARSSSALSPSSGIKLSSPSITYTRLDSPNFI